MEGAIDPGRIRCDNEYNMPFQPGTEIILVVDDELAVLNLTQMMLARYGYGVLVASSGKEALRLFEVWPDIHIDLMLVDLVMPEMNGIELVEKIHGFRPDLPFLYFSGYSDRQPLRPRFDRNVPFIAKPFTSIQLTNRIREILDKPKSDVATAE